MFKRSFKGLGFIYSVCVVLIPIALFIGHIGAEIDWRKFPISTFAKKAPQDDWITAGMCLAALSMILLGEACRRIFEGRIFPAVLSTLFSFSAGGLLLLAYFEEIKFGVKSYGQGHHDAGLWLFVVTAFAALFLLALGLLFSLEGWAKLYAVIVGMPIGVALFGWELMRAGQVGLGQRLAFAALWAAMVFMIPLVWPRSGSDNTLHSQSFKEKHR
jgi:hypothetical protein